MKKQTTQAFNKKIYLLGADANGKKYWLKAPSWDCGWYWGFGYVETYTNNNHPERAKDIKSHQFFDDLFFDNGICGYNAFKNFFVDTTLTNDEIWRLCDYMKTFYTLKAAAKLFGHGHSYYTSKAKIQILQDDDLTQNINEKMMPELFKQIDILLSPNND